MLGRSNSHLWFFSAFCRHIAPEYVLVLARACKCSLDVSPLRTLSHDRRRPQLLDVGTVPRRSAMAMLVAALDANPQLGGVCGEIAVKEPRYHNVLEVRAVLHGDDITNRVLIARRQPKCSSTRSRTS